MKTSSEIDTKVACELGEDELYALLGDDAVDHGKDGELAIYAIKMYKNKSVAALDDGVNLISKGKQKFQKYWPKIKSAVCKMKVDGDKVSDKDLADALVAIILKIINVSGLTATLIAAIIVKAGLNVLCSSK